MVHQAMGGRRSTKGHRFVCFAVLTFVIQIGACWSLNSEGLDLLEFRDRINSDSHGIFLNWNANDNDPCLWSGVHCEDGKVHTLNLEGLHLEGTLAPELGKLARLRSLVLSKNRFSGAIPNEIGGLTALELLDLRDNDLSGEVPAEIGSLLSLKRLLISDNNFEGSIPLELGKLSLLVEFQFDENLSSALPTEIGCINRKFGHCIWQNSLRQLSKAGSLIPNKEALKRSSEQHIVQNVKIGTNFARRRLFEQSSNLQALPAPDGSSPETNVYAPSIRSSGSYQAIPNVTTKQHATSPPDPPLEQNPNPSNKSFTRNSLKYTIIGSGVAALLIVLAVMAFMCKRRGVPTIGPWKTGLSGQLQKAFVTGVPKLNRNELETACEDFSNIIHIFDGCTIYKGTLSSGVEIAVASTTVPSAKEWSKSSETIYRKKIDSMSRVNHKNCVNLLGYCEEDEPFLRMMVFEYAPNGTLFEHLHIKEVEHLDWNARIRIIMGTAYSLQHMHHDLNPPVSHPSLVSTTIFLTDDYAAKIGDLRFWKEAKSRSNSSDGTEASEHSEFPLADPETNVYNFGILLLEIISGKLPYSEELGSIVDWAAEYMNDRSNISCMVDPTLKSFKIRELEVICEVIQDCIQSDPRQRPTMKELTSKLRGVINITPDAATPRLSPLWWAELEILSVEAT